MNNVKAYGYKRVSKRKARSLFKDGVIIYLLPSNIKLNNPWMKPSAIVYNEKSGNNFDSYSDEFKFYNCNNETGKDIWYYIKET